VADSGEEEEPVYGAPTCRASSRSAVAVPPVNDVDVFANDLGFIAIVDDAGVLAGFNLSPSAAAWARPTATPRPTRGWQRDRLRHPEQV
jgi:hypothetical protein